MATGILRSLGWHDASLSNKSPSKNLHLYSKMKEYEVTRSYKLLTNPTGAKADLVEWQAYQFRKFTNAYVNHIFFAPKGTRVEYSTAGMGWLVNQAKHKAKGIVNGAKAAAEATGNKSSCPDYTGTASPAWITKPNKMKFDYAIKFSFAFADERAKPTYIPAKSHKALNRALKEGWALTEACELFKDKNGKWYARVFVTKKVTPNDRQLLKKPLGMDVNGRHATARSDGYLGQNGWRKIKREKAKNGERRRQRDLREIEGAYSRSLKSSQKQQLDVEAKFAVRRAVLEWRSLAAEDPKRLANLRGKYQDRWARCYLANRLSILAREHGTYTVFVNPAYTSQMCNRCLLIDRRNRNGVLFCCIQCGLKAHADTNAAKNIALKGLHRGLTAQRRKSRQVAVISETAKPTSHDAK
jgi:hypothetical protein